MLRDSLSRLADAPWDVLVVGGGATGLGVAVQAALEGRRVALVEARDFACGTSSRSTKLLHGGVRYLAQGRVKLVREALHERSVVLGLAPHLAQPLPFVVAERSRWSWLMTALGLKAYQWLAGRRSLGATEALGAASLRQRMPAMPGVIGGVQYWDGQFDDARLALALARTAQAAGAEVRNHTEVMALSQQDGQGWRVDLRDALTGETVQVQAGCVVNATGVWVDALRGLALAGKSPNAGRPLVRPSQGVHVVVDRALLPLDCGVLVPRTDDGRVLFAVPWLGATVIGTTDTPREDVPLEPRPLASELDFLFGQAQRSLGVRIEPADVRSVWVGLRPLVDAGNDGTTAGLSREHLILREAPGFVTVTGGKWTTYRVMAEDVMRTLVAQGDLGATQQPAATQRHVLFGAPDGKAGVRSIRETPGVHLLGSEAALAASLPGHDRPLGLGLTEAVVRYCARHEQAVTVEDMLARRWRVLFLDAQAARKMAPRVAEVLQEETGLPAQLPAFLDLCTQYCLQGAVAPPAPGT